MRQCTYVYHVRTDTRSSMDIMDINTDGVMVDTRSYTCPRMNTIVHVRLVSLDTQTSCKINDTIQL